MKKQIVTPTGCTVIKNTEEVFKMRLPGLMGFVVASIDREDCGGWTMGGGWGEDFHASDDGWYSLHDAEHDYAATVGGWIEASGEIVWETRHGAVAALRAAVAGAIDGI